MIKLGVIFGGRSGEHAVSLMSAAKVMSALDPEKYQVVPIGITRQGQWMHYDGPLDGIEDGSWELSAHAFSIDDLKKKVDFALPILHGPYGEDGTIQGLFEMLNVPYAGCGVLASSLAMDKIMTKEVLRAANLPSCPYVAVLSEELSEAEAEEKAIACIENALRYPLFVKPANMGSSVGISKVKTRQTLTEALRAAAAYDRRLIVEQGVAGREMETAVLGNFAPEAAEVGEIIPSAEFYDYSAKYLDGKSKICIPASIAPDIREEIRSLAVQAYKALDCAGFARIDFFLEDGTDRVYINEINTIPGFTKYSMFPLLWESAGVTYSRLFERIVELGYERYYAKDHR